MTLSRGPRIALSIATTTAGVAMLIFALLSGSHWADALGVAGVMLASKGAVDLARLGGAVDQAQ